MTKKRTSVKKPTTKRKRRESNDVADWGGIDPRILQVIIGTVTKGDGAIRFGYSSDGGAYALGIYGDGKPYTEYHRADDDVEDWLKGFIEDYG